MIHANEKPARKFHPGRIVATPGAIEVIEAAGQRPSFFLSRHLQCDWGKICSEDRELNDQGLIDGSRLLSVYVTDSDERIWIITEATDSWGQRIATTILLPSEY